MISWLDPLLTMMPHSEGRGAPNWTPYRPLAPAILATPIKSDVNIHVGIMPRGFTTPTLRTIHFVHFFTPLRALRGAGLGLERSDANRIGMSRTF
jgi:hypothetical protein